VSLLELIDVLAFCRTREVDLVMAPPPAPYTLCLRGEFNCYGEFFHLLAKDVEYVELCAGFPVGDLAMVSDLSSLSSLAPKWSRLSRLYSPPALVIRTADVDAWGSDDHSFIVIAETLEWHAGRDWGRSGSPGGALR